MMKIFKSLAIITAVVAIAGGGTYAWQLQQETISGITYSAGSMDLKIDSNTSSSQQSWVDGFNTNGGMDKNGLKPGSFGEQIIDIKSEGDVNATASVRIDTTFNRENTLLTPEVEVGDTYIDNILDGELAQNMMVKISFDAGNTGTFVEKYNYTVAQYEANPSLLALGAITNAEGIASVKLEWSIPSDASNNIMTDQIGLAVVFGLE
jgi:hypothetical protein